MRIIYLCLIIIVSISCTTEKSQNLVEINLLEHNIPLTMKAPEESEITVEDLGVWKDVQIKKGEKFFIQLIASDATTYNVNDIISENKTRVKNGKFFSKLVQEFKDGFIFEQKIDSLINYDFRLIRIQGDKEFIFQTGFLGTFSEEDVQIMYQACQAN